VKKKYEFTGEIEIVYGRVLHRIRALRDFGDVKKGDLGGWIEKEDNLSHKGNCWVCDEAMVYDNAQVRDNVRICNNARIYNNAKIFDKAWVCGNARIYDDARICDDALIYGNAQVHGEATVYENARIYDNAKVFHRAKVYGRARVYGNAWVYGNAEVFGRARVYGTVGICKNARVYGMAHVKYGELTKDIKEDLIQYIACSLNVYPVNGKYILYKRVNKIAKGKYISLFNPDFMYEDGKIVEVKHYDPNFKTSCSAGIHCSTPFYWDDGDTLIAVEVKIEDIITCMEDKIRARKVKVLGEVER